MERGFVLACLNLTLEEFRRQWKKEALAARAEMTAVAFAKVIHGSGDKQGVQRVIDALPQAMFVRFMEHLGRARGVYVREIDTIELTDQFFEAVERMVQLGMLLRVRRATPAKASLRVGGQAVGRRA